MIIYVDNGVFKYIFACIHYLCKTFIKHAQYFNMFSELFVCYVYQFNFLSFNNLLTLFVVDFT